MPEPASVRPTVGRAIDDSQSAGPKLLLAAADALHANGQETTETARAIDRLAAPLGHPVTLVLRWGEVLIQGQAPDADLPVGIRTTMPTSVAINRVVTTMSVIDAVRAGTMRPDMAEVALKNAASEPPSSDALFVLACALGASMLALIFGASHWKAVILTALSAGAGGILRRTMGRMGANVVFQAFAAACMAGVVGALAVRWGVSSALRLVAVCPCMVLVPGPHILNGALDLLAFRIPLGIARLVFAGMILLAISTGLLIGLALLGGDLPAFESGRTVPFWMDLISAGVVASCYGVFFSMPLHMLGWPVAIGMVAHAARWWIMSAFEASAAAGAGVACLVAGTITVMVARRYRLPFAGVGFASVVSLIPGVFVFRMNSGLLQIEEHGATLPPALMGEVLSEGITAAAIVLAMILGLSLPQHLAGRLRSPNTGRDKAT